MIIAEGPYPSCSLYWCTSVNQQNTEERRKTAVSFDPGVALNSVSNGCCWVFILLVKVVVVIVAAVSELDLMPVILDGWCLPKSEFIQLPPQFLTFLLFLLLSEDRSDGNHEQCDFELNEKSKDVILPLSVRFVRGRQFIKQLAVNLHQCF